ncbi:hypothetical protein CEXT_797021 [Caerostris extrusa]|uniref:Uncharacterized protein n=1 Tax=Caerostris extrusa TaxID=172846 RepID=A0AAV4Q8W3_CAEEX|nr:hypothetical protein CEXT_797021 [Caerostris extrusa]
MQSLRDYILYTEVQGPVGQLPQEVNMFSGCGIPFTHLKGIRQAGAEEFHLIRPTRVGAHPLIPFWEPPMARRRLHVNALFCRGFY